MLGRPPCSTLPAQRFFNWYRHLALDIKDLEDRRRGRRGGARNVLSVLRNDAVVLCAWREGTQIAQPHQALRAAAVELSAAAWRIAWLSPPSSSRLHIRPLQGQHLQRLRLLGRGPYRPPALFFLGEEPPANLAVWFAVSVLIELSSNIPTQTNEHILGRVCRKSSFIAAHVVHSEWKMCDSPMHSTSPQQTKQRLSDVRFPTLQNFHICLGSVKRAQNQRGFRRQPGCGRKTLSTVH